MTLQQGIIFGTQLLTLVLFVSGRWRYDGMALLLEIIVAAVAIPLILLVWELIKQEDTTLCTTRLSGGRTSWRR